MGAQHTLEVTRRILVAVLYSLAVSFTEKASHLWCFDAALPRGGGAESAWLDIWKAVERSFILDACFLVLLLAAVGAVYVGKLKNQRVAEAWCELQRLLYAYLFSACRSFAGQRS